jgi:DNA-binding NarL/FixJ family response regulator
MDRSKSQVLVVINKGNVSTQVRQSLKSLGFTQVSVVNTHVAAIERAQERNFSHYIVDAKDTDMTAIDFIQKIMTMEREPVILAVSEEPRIDDVFSLLKVGARGFLVPPLNVEVIEQVLVQASKGPVLSEAVLNAPDRNAAFVAVVLNNLYRLAVSMRQSREFVTAERDVKFYNYALRESMEMAQLFCEGSDEDLREKIVDACINRAKDAASRLGRLRKKLSKTRTVGEGGEPEAEEASV